MQSGFFSGTSWCHIADQCPTVSSGSKFLRKVWRDVLNNDTQVSTHDLTGFRDLFHDRSRHIRWDRETDAEVPPCWTENRRVHPDQFTARIDQSSTRISGVDGRVRLNKILLVFNAEI